MIRKLLSFTSLFVSLLSMTTAIAQNTAIQSFTATSTFTGTWTLGWRFSTTQSITVQELGAFDVGNDGLNGSIPVSIWDEATQVVMIRDTVPAGTVATLINGWRYINVTPTILPPGTYRIGAYTASSDLNQIGTPTTHTNITFLSGCWDNGDAYPVTASGGPYMNPNFIFTSDTSCATTSYQTISACISATINGNTYTNTQTVRDTMAGANSVGCDSVVTTYLTILNPTSYTDTRSECTSLVWIDGNTYTTNNNSATYTYTGGAANGCDSTVTLDLTILNPATSTDTRSECTSLVWIDGNTYTTNNNSATYTYTGGASNGCDSTVTLDLTILNPTTYTDIRSACTSLVWIDGNTYTTNNNSATYTYTGGAANGCDSIVTLNLTIAPSSTVDSIDFASCDSIMLNGNTYDSSQQITDTLIGQGGCDSIVVTNLTINSSYSIVKNISITQGSSYTVDTNTYTANGTYIDTMIATTGCDSIVTTNLTVTIPGSMAEQDISGLSLYPNPADNVVYIKASNIDLNSIHIINALGKNVVKFVDFSTNGNKIAVDITELDNGIYFISIDSKMSKLIIER